MYSVISQRTEGRGQTVDYIEHGVLKDGRKHTLRVRIHDDSYAKQAYGIVERWDGQQWREVASLGGEAFMLEHGIGYRKLTEAARIAAFEADRDTLLRLATEVL